MSEPEVTIIIPNYKTPELTKICLRLLNKFTPAGELKIIAVDNHSEDASVEYLRTLPWITLLERPAEEVTQESGPKMHAKALDLALSKVTTPFVLVIHTDTFVIREDWLDFLLSKIKADPMIAGVGSWKLEHVSALKSFGKKLEKIYRKLLGFRQCHEERYLRSHCALYKTDLIRKYTHGFDDNDTAGHSLHKLLVKEGFRMEFLESEELGKYIRHLNHATGILNPGNNSRQSGNRKTKHRLKNAMDLFTDVLNQSEWDVRKAAGEK